MPIRIYAFAKELGFDNKQLLDVCDKVNIKGKGSALASLDDDEVAKVKEFLATQGGTAIAEPEVEERPLMRPPTVRPATRKISELAPSQIGDAQASCQCSPKLHSASPAEPDAEPETPAKVKTNVGGLLSKLRRKKAAPASGRTGEGTPAH